MKGIIEFRILKAAGLDFKQFESNPMVRKEFENHCRKIVDGLKEHFKKHKMEVEAGYKIEK